MPLPPGTSIGPHELGSLLGEGGMGEVYRARDTRLNREVAIQVLPANVAADQPRSTGSRRRRGRRFSWNDPRAQKILEQAKPLKR